MENLSPDGCSSNSAHNNETTELKRKIQSDNHNIQKRHKYENVVDFIKASEWNNESEQQLKTIIQIGLDVNKEDDNGCTPLFYAVSYNRHEWIQPLIECGADPSLDYVVFQGSTRTATDTAWNNAHYNVVLKLLEADGPFPRDVNIQVLSFFPDFLKILTRRKAIHDHIENNRLEKVAEFVEKNPRTKYAYDEYNNCALTTALKFKSFEIYAFLRLKGFANGITIDQYHDKLMESLEREDKNKLVGEIQKHFKSANRHVLDLLSKSRLGLNNDQENFKKILTYLESLDELPKVQPILKILASVQNLSIVFDFNSDSICDVDPVRCFTNNVKGRTYPNSRQIFIGAKRTEDEVLGTLAHEMTHYAMELLYKNNCCPYRLKDSEREKQFYDIICEASCTEPHLQHEVVEMVFAYGSERFPSELIVRVPQLVALYRNEPEKLNEIRENYAQLFDFYDRYFMPEVEKELLLIESKRKVNEFNKLLGTFYSLKSSKIHCDKTKTYLDEVFHGSENILVHSKIPQFVMSSLITNLKTNDVESIYVFITVEQLKDQANLSRIDEVITSDHKPTLVILDSIDVETEKIKDILSPLASRTRIVLVSSRSVDDLQKNFKQLIEVAITWNDLSEVTRKEILNTKITFQDSEVSLIDLLPENSDIFSELPIELIFDIKNLKLNSFNDSLPPLDNIFIERSFKRFSTGRMLELLTVNDITEMLESQKCQKTIILADSAGMGKTTSAISLAKSLKKRNRLSWVFFIDLKQHTVSYLEDNKKQPDTIHSEFFSRHLLNLKNRFEQKLFEEMYKNSKTIFVIDGFDEISPSYKKFVLKLLKAVQQSENHLLVTTRTHFVKELEDELAAKAITFQPFDGNNQIEFLTRFWHENQTESTGNLGSKAQIMLHKFRQTLGQAFLEVPLQLFMLAQVNEIQLETDKQLNFYSLYKQFIVNKINIWINRGPLAVNDNTNLQMSSFNVLLVHQKIALEYFFGKDKIKPLLLPEFDDPLTNELITRIGIMKITVAGEFLFVHQTFAEFLVAAFILANILMKTPLSTYDAVHEILLEVLNDEKYGTVRKFVDGNLESNTKKLQIEDFSIKFEETLKIKNNWAFLTRLVEEQHLNVITFVLKTVQMDKQTKLQLMQHRSGVGNAIHNAIKNYDAFKTLWNSAESFAEVSELKKILFVNGWSGRNVLGCTVDMKGQEVLKFVLDFCNTSMDSDEFFKLVSQKYDVNGDSFRTALQESAKYVVDFPAFDLLWKTVEQKLNVEDKKKLLFYENSDDFFEFMYNLELNSAAILPVLQAIKKLHSHDELQTILRRGNSLLKVLIYYAVEADPKVFESIWNFIQENLDTSERKSLLLQRNEDNEHIFLFQNDDKSTTKLIFTIAKEHLALDDFREILFAEHEDGRSGLGTACDSGSIEIINDIIQQLDSESTRREIQTYLLKRDFRGEHVLNRLYWFNNGPDPLNLFNFVTKHLEKEDIIALMIDKNVDNRNLLLYAVEKAKEVSRNIFFWAIQHFQRENWERIICERDTSSKNILHILSWRGTDEVMTILGDYFDSFKMYVTKPMLLATDDSGRTPLEWALHNDRGSLLSVQLVWKLYNIILTSDELESLLFGKGRDFFVSSGGSMDERFISYLREVVIERFGEEKFFNLF